MSDIVQITGTVKRRFQSRTGPAVALTVQSGKKLSLEVSVWADLDVAEGDRVTVEGSYSDRVDSYDSPSGRKLTVRRNLNDVHLVERHEVPPQDAAPFDPTQEPPEWGEVAYPPDTEW